MKILSIDGGGYLGLATAAFVNGIERHFGKRLTDQFELYCGTSTGAILSLAIAAGKTGAELVDLYTKLGKSVFGEWSSVRSALRFGRSIVTSKYGSTDLQKALSDTFADLAVGDLRRAGKKILITAFCTTTGAPRLFKTDHSDNLTLHDKLLVRDVALASAAAPSFFPLVRLTNPINGVEEEFCDGGVPVLFRSLSATKRLLI